MEVKNRHAEPIKLKKPYCRVSSLTQEITTSTAKTATPNTPSWNEDCTFTVRDEHEELLIEIYDKKKKATKSERHLLGQVVLSIHELPANKMVDLWEEICPPPIFDSKFIVTGKLHLVAQRSRNAEAMMLSNYGEPQRDLPIRLDSCDLILVSNSRLITHTVHLSTRSQWDHVAMVIKTTAHDELLLFEATNDGVEVFLLDTALKIYRQNAKVAIRRLNVERTEEFSKTLYEFVEETDGRPYKSDWIQLVRAAYNANEEDDLTSLFCSQLIAACFQRLGLISKDVRSNNFVPSDFAGDLLGLTGATMSNLRKIPSVSKKDGIALKEQYKNGDYNGSIQFDIEDKLYNVKFTSTATKKDAKLNMYTVYMLDVTTFAGWHWMLFKRFNDFVALDKELQKYFSNIPSLPRKYLVAKFDVSTIQKRRVALQHYFKQLLQSEAASCSILYDFLADGRKGVTLKERKIKKSKTERKKKSSSPKLRKRHRGTINTSTDAMASMSHSMKMKKKKTRSTTRSASDYHPINTDPLPPSPLKSASAWTNFKPNSARRERNLFLAAPNSAVISRRPRPAPSKLKDAQSLSDISSMFGAKFGKKEEETLEPVSIPTARETLAPGKRNSLAPNSRAFKRSSAQFYLKKFATPIDGNTEEESALDYYCEQSESSEEENCDDSDVKCAENILKLSDIGSLDLATLGIDDVDLSQFGINDNESTTLQQSEVDELLGEFGV